MAMREQAPPEPARQRQQLLGEGLACQFPLWPEHAGDLDGIVVLAVDSATEAYRGGEVPIQVLVDGSDPNTADLVRNFVEALWVNWMEQQLLDLGQPTVAPGVHLDHRLWFNPEVSSRNYLVPGSAAMILTLIGAGVSDSSTGLGKTQSGFARTYALTMLLGAVIVAATLVVRF
jgi:ABC-type multidrug transport system permease subunit